MFMDMRNTAMSNTKQLIQMANELYNNESPVSQWVETFKPLELAKLWHETCVITKDNPFGAGYDDEVYEVLNILGYFEGGDK